MAAPRSAVAAFIIGAILPCSYNHFFFRAVEWKTGRSSIYLSSSSSSSSSSSYLLSTITSARLPPPSSESIT
jgi:hypothetical protein